MGTANLSRLRYFVSAVLAPVEPTIRDVSRRARVGAELRDADRVRRAERKRNGAPAFQDVHEKHCLGFDALAELPTFTSVSVTWRGGNGPHRYELIRSSDGRVWGITFGPDENVVGFVLAKADEPMPRGWIELEPARPA